MAPHVLGKCNLTPDDNDNPQYILYSRYTRIKKKEKIRYKIGPIGQEYQGMRRNWTKG